MEKKQAVIKKMSKVQMQKVVGGDDKPIDRDKVRVPTNRGRK